MCFWSVPKWEWRLNIVKHRDPTVILHSRQINDPFFHPVMEILCCFAQTKWEKYYEIPAARASGFLCRTSWTTWSHVTWTTTTSCWTPTSRKTPRCTAVRVCPSVWVVSAVSVIEAATLPSRSCRGRRCFPDGPVEEETAVLGDPGGAWQQVGVGSTPVVIKRPFPCSREVTKCPLLFPQWPPGRRLGKHWEKDFGRVQGRRPHLGPLPHEVVFKIETER